MCPIVKIDSNAAAAPPPPPPPPPPPSLKLQPAVPLRSFHYHFFDHSAFLLLAHLKTSDKKFHPSPNSCSLLHMSDVQALTSILEALLRALFSAVTLSLNHPLIFIKSHTFKPSFDINTSRNLTTIPHASLRPIAWPCSYA